MLMNTRTKTGLLFGSFNPVHNGHMHIAHYMLTHEELDEIWFVLSPQNPLKSTTELAPVNYRLEMLKLAVACEPRFRICEKELTMPSPSYTINTLKALTTSHPDNYFYIIIGSDNFNEFRLWKNYRRILRDYKLLVYPRAGIIKTAQSHYAGVKITNAPTIEISSSAIRGMILKGEDVGHLLPAGVANFIESARLYYCNP